MRIRITALSIVLVAAAGLTAFAVRGCTGPKQTAPPPVATAPVPEHPDFHGALPPPAADPATGRPLENSIILAPPPLLSVETDIQPAITHLETALATAPTGTATDAADTAFDAALVDFRSHLAAGDNMESRAALKRMLNMTSAVSPLMLSILKNDLEVLARNRGAAPR